MPSEHGDRFNHDPYAEGYDRDVVDESNPIRAGYDQLLSWVASNVPKGSRVVDLGCGTGNLAVRVAEPGSLICVDLSANMIEKARAKLAERPVTFVQADLLDCFEQLPTVDAIISTYAIHHLVAGEKWRLFAHVFDKLTAGGHAVFGDLMFESQKSAKQIYAEYIDAGNEALAEEIESEFFWHLDTELAKLRELGFTARAKRFSNLSWGVLATKP